MRSARLSYVKERSVTHHVREWVVVVMPSRLAALQRWWASWQLARSMVAPPLERGVMWSTVGPSLWVPGKVLSTHCPQSAQKGGAVVMKARRNCCQRVSLRVIGWSCWHGVRGLGTGVDVRLGLTVAE